MKILSKENKKIKNLVRLRDKKKDRYDNKLYYVEGERIIRNIDVSLIDEIYIEDGYDGYIPSIDEDKIYILSKDVFKYIKDTVTTQGIIATVKIIDIDIDKNDMSPIVILDNVKDPGNMGTIIRTSEAAGVKKIILLGDNVDPYSPKAIRSSMSSITRVSIIEKDIDYINSLKSDGYKIYGTFLEDSTCIYEDKYEGKIAIAFGNEANGISGDVGRLCDYRIHIPMDGKIESLNVSQSVAIVLYEIKRKRHIINEK